MYDNGVMFVVRMVNESCRSPPTSCKKALMNTFSVFRARLDEISHTHNNGTTRSDRNPIVYIPVEPVDLTVHYVEVVPQPPAPSRPTAFAPGQG